MDSEKISIRERIFLYCVILLAALMLLMNLNNHYLWQDEAQTALIGKTVITNGIPYGTDGKNYFSQELGVEYGKNFIWRWHPWLQFYLIAGSFIIFGINTFAARLPFALFGLFTIPLLYYFVRSLYKDKRAAAVATILLLLCIPFFLLSRQCRYYSVATFFSLLGLYSYLKIIQKRRFSILLFIFSTFFLFHTHYIYCVPLYLTVSIHSLIFHRKEWKSVIKACTGGIILLLPWILWFSGVKYSQAYGNLFNPAISESNLKSFLYQINQWSFPWCLLLLPLLVALFVWIREKRLAWGNLKSLSSDGLVILFIFATLSVLSLTAPLPFFRYLAPLIPILMIIAGRIVIIAGRIHYCLSLLVLTSVLILQPIPDFFYELTHDYNGPIKGIVKFLNAYAKPQDVVAITYGDMPLKFYTNLRVIGGLTGEDLSGAKDARWVIFRRDTNCSKDAAVKEYFKNNLDFHKYRLIEINSPDIPFENRESPYEHKYRTVKNVPRVQILERIR